MKKVLLPLLLLSSFLIMGCNNKEPFSISITPGDGDPNDPQEPNDPSDPNEPQDPIEETEYVSYTIDFNSNDCETGDSGKDAEAFATKLKTLINKEYTIVDSISIDGYIQVNKKNDVKTLSMSSRTQDGELSIKFLKDLVSISITATPFYSKYVSGGQSEVTISDDENKLTVNNEVWDLTPPISFTGTKEPEKESKTFNINSKDLVLSSEAKQRVMIYNMTLTFEK